MCNLACCGVPAPHPCSIETLAEGSDWDRSKSECFECIPWPLFAAAGSNGEKQWVASWKQQFGPHVLVTELGFHLLFQTTWSQTTLVRHTCVTFQSEGTVITRADCCPVASSQWMWIICNLIEKSDMCFQKNKIIWKEGCIKRHSKRLLDHLHKNPRDWFLPGEGRFAPSIIFSVCYRALPTLRPPRSYCTLTLTHFTVHFLVILIVYSGFGRFGVSVELHCVVLMCLHHVLLRSHSFSLLKS